VQPFDQRTITQFFKLVTLFTHSFDFAECGLWIADLKNFLKNIKIRNPKYGKFRFAGFRGVRSRRGFLRQPYNEPFPDIVYFLEGIC